MFKSKQILEELKAINKNLEKILILQKSKRIKPNGTKEEKNDVQPNV